MRQFICSDTLQVNSNTNGYVLAISFVLSASDMLIIEIALVILNLYHISSSFSFQYESTGTVDWRIEWMRLLASLVAPDIHLTDYPTMTTTDFWTSHECLFIPYKQGEFCSYLKKVYQCFTLDC
jgi:hypothetical protein